MKAVFLSGGALAAVMMLGSCASMSEAQCLAGDWSRQGYTDGLAGLGESRLQDHAEACAKHGVVPDSGVYFAGREEGLRGYCVPQRGFDEGLRGNSYAGVCRGRGEGAFVEAYNDGREIYQAEQILSQARSRVDSLGARLADLDDKISHFDRESRDTSLTDAQRNAARNRVRELRRERDGTMQDWRAAQRDVEDAERNARDVRYYFSGRYRF